MSILSLEMSFEQNQLEYLNASAASEDSPRSQGVLESNGGSTEPPSSTVDPATSILSIRHRLASIVRELEKMERGEIKELSVQQNMLQQLASLECFEFRVCHFDASLGFEDALNEANPCLPPMHRGAAAGLVRKTSPN